VTSRTRRRQGRHVRKKRERIRALYLREVLTTLSMDFFDACLPNIFPVVL
jgi:hypothetical protein